jgi:hypothetical protein
VALVVQLAIDATDEAHNDVILAAIMEREVALHQRLVGAVLEVIKVPLGVDDACGTGTPL